MLLYDIESDPDARDDFLHGLLRLERREEGWPSSSGAERAPYHPLLALQEHGEERLWQRLSGLLERYPDWPLLHYGETEAISLLRLAERQGATEAEHRALWKDPDVFDPDRFAPGSPEANRRFVYMPFGAGPRICIGATFAMNEAVSVLATLIRGARFGHDSRRFIRPLVRISMRPEGGMPMTVRRR